MTSKTPVQCNCGARFAAGPELQGKQVPCPSCGNPLRIPGGPAKTAASAAGANAGKVPVTCGCGAQFLTNRDLLGKTVPCPNCNQPLRIGGGRKPAAAAPADTVAAALDDPLGDPLLGAAQAAAPLASSSPMLRSTPAPKRRSTPQINMKLVGWIAGGVGGVVVLIVLSVVINSYLVPMFQNPGTDVIGSDQGGLDQRAEFLEWNRPTATPVDPEWQFTANERYRGVVPRIGSGGSKSKATPQGRLTTFTTSGETKQGQATIVFEDLFAEGTEIQGEPQAILDTTVEGLKKLMGEKKGAQVTAVNNVQLSGYPGRELILEGSDGGVAKKLKCRLYLVDHQLVQLYSEGPPAFVDSPAVDQFFETFELKATWKP